MKNRTVAVGCDHAGFALKQTVIDRIIKNGDTALDLGTCGTDSVDYPDFARAVALKVAGGEAGLGVLICGSGVGVCIAANKFKNIRAGLCHDTYSAAQGVEHDHMNVLCLGARIVGAAVAESIVDAFLKARQTTEGRHLRRLGKISEIEKENMK
ncbi:MAG: ribose 5-phosphate isomerase B [Elusimicrobiaceae bacterium]|nr:ribose 5-phosphate isomerase B [Elusimicrobiaceae bacterium]